MVLISPSSTGSIAAGSEYTLTCIALKTASGLTNPAQTHWTGPSGAPVVTNNTIILGKALTESLRSVQNVTFSSLSTSEAGVYMCDSSLSSPALSTPYQTMESHTVTLSGIFSPL